MAHRGLWTAGCLLAGLAVAAGAFGAHALRGTVGPEGLAVWETAARYQMYHALALLVLAAVLPRTGAGHARVAGWLLVAGVVVFSGSLYALTLTGLRALGAVTPFGGAALLAGWGLLATTPFRQASPAQDA